MSDSEDDFKFNSNDDEIEEYPRRRRRYVVNVSPQQMINEYSPIDVELLENDALFSLGLRRQLQQLYEEDSSLTSMETD